VPQSGWIIAEWPGPAAAAVAAAANISSFDRIIMDNDGDDDSVARGYGFPHRLRVVAELSGSYKPFYTPFIDLVPRSFTACCDPCIDRTVAKIRAAKVQA